MDTVFGGKYGRSDEEWQLLVEQGHRFLVEKARLKRQTTYTEFNAVVADRTGVRAFDFDQESERAAMGHLLELIVEQDVHRTGLMLSVLVQYLGENDAGTGFYKLAAELGLLPARSPAEKRMEFWIGQLNGVYDYFAKATT